MTDDERPYTRVSAFSVPCASQYCQTDVSGQTLRYEFCFLNECDTATTRWSSSTSCNCNCYACCDARSLCGGRCYENKCLLHDHDELFLISLAHHVEPISFSPLLIDLHTDFAALAN
jgi:hypothetical protein